MPTEDNETNATDLAKLLAIINQLQLRAFSSSSREALIFHILNDTKKLVAYDRASLWDLTGQQPKCLGISGQTKVAQESPVVRDIAAALSNLKSLRKTEILDLSGRLPGEEDLRHDFPEGLPSILWVPVTDELGASIGLWLERWRPPKWTAEQGRVIEHLMQGYKTAWRMHQRWWRLSPPSKSKAGWVALVVLLFLFVIRVPLRIVAPCEVVARDPVLITAPLEGIVAQMEVKPGEVVQKDETLFAYDKRVPLQELKIAEKQVEVTQAQLNRVLTLGLSDPNSLNEAAVWKNQLAKDNIELDLARYHASQLDVKSPINGIAIFENPDEWRGKPVKVGERVLVISRPEQTKVRILLPERDNVLIEKDRPVKIVLNINPLTNLYAKLSYVSDFSIMTEKGVPSFAAEAEWVDQEPDVKLGLKGTAILYGENVSLFYWIIRKPLAKIREFLGL